MSDVRTRLVHSNCGVGGVHCPCCNTDRFNKGSAGRRARARNRTHDRGAVRTRTRDFDRRDLSHNPH